MRRKRTWWLWLIVGIFGATLWWLSRQPSQPRPIPALAAPAAGLPSPAYDKAELIVEMVKGLSTTRARIESLQQGLQARRTAPTNQMQPMNRED